ncbi:MAG TPA: FAD-dependent oxidoreductase, partial [Alphaproteobacteria bacterium]|nr:FAD-dependent oxidoreductase [Alphaproteobacteria bacterium]
MSERHDAIIIGAGIIGAAVGLELARKGWRCLNLDRNPAAGYGSTSSSAAVIRTHYSTLDGTAMAWEAYHAWRDWPAHVGAADERGLVEFRETGCLAMHSPEEMAPVLAHLDALGIRWEAWGPAEIRRRLPGVDLRRFGPPRRPDDPAFGAPGGDGIEAAVFMPQAGYVPDPQLATHNLQRGAEALGGRFRFNAEVAEVLREG